MKVCIAEKPSVAKGIAEVLGATSRKDGYFEGNGYCVTWTYGHLCTLKEPNDYIESCREGLKSALVPLTVDSIVAVGDPLTTYQYFLAEHEVNLLVINTKDENQHAMQNLAYTLAVELRDIPLLML